MRVPRIYLSHVSPGVTCIELDERAAHYTKRALRLIPGSAIQVFDGKGNAGSPTWIVSGAATSAATLGAGLTDRVRQNSRPATASRAKTIEHAVQRMILWVLVMLEETTLPSAELTTETDDEAHDKVYDKDI